MSATGLVPFASEAIDGLRSVVVRDDQMSPTLERRVYVHCGNLVLCRERFHTQWKGTEVRLTVRQYLMVEHLASLHGMDASWRELYDVVRGKGFVAGDGEHGLRQTVRTWIKRIRKAFSEIDPDFDQIEARAFDGLGSDLAPCWLTLGLVATRGGASASETEFSVSVFAGLGSAKSSSEHPAVADLGRFERDSPANRGATSAINTGIRRAYGTNNTGRCDKSPSPIMPSLGSVAGISSMRR